MKKLCQVSWPQTTDQKAEVRSEANQLFAWQKIVGFVLDPNTCQYLGLSHTGNALVFTTGTCLAVAVPSSTAYYVCLGKFYLILKIR